MDIEAVNQQLSRLVDKVGNDVESKMNASDLNDPTSMLQAQFAIQQYSVFVGYQSAVLKAVKDMLSGIIQKI
ncbi:MULTISPECIES: type III secretion system needle filament subunit SctF [Burkholderia]|uniref:Type III secretion system needle protein SsaG n=1 Tax=Burkholderia savannae TaxID=1637837 RepID=A0ABR5T4L0_9BURK|nr:MULTISPECIES: type III secretion system needle filament subunit SctF [Burkholderia]AOJ71472.1 type III secretion system needle protein SsaG [Burkholderia savannae]AOJ83902.1 type III secretion system needle protein SsaG [Burkholderia savannae]AOK49865.1 type III secretion system needle protein SsaG [Burkholderia sp. MSMB617WGS]KGS02395.1 type III secretion apparatus needle protein [Burkholderia sp. ABCPW 111]KVG37137.1 type III secretion system needle protein SsaG [Burkholderia sp. MSMB0265